MEILIEWRGLQCLSSKDCWMMILIGKEKISEICYKWIMVFTLMPPSLNENIHYYYYYYKDKKSMFCLYSALVSLILNLDIWEWFHQIQFVFLIPKHPSNMKIFDTSPEKIASELCNWKLENPDFWNRAPKFQISKNSIFHLNDYMHT